MTINQSETPTSPFCFTVRIVQAAIDHEIRIRIDKEN